MLKAFQVQDHVLNELNFEFKELLFANIANYCQMHLLIAKVSFKFVNPCKLCARKSGGTK